MPRRHRTQAPGVLYHVASRAVDKQPIFGVIDHDRQFFVDMLELAVRTFSWRLHAYCVMGNHFHLVLDTPESNLAAGMQYVKGRYAQWFNRWAGREGALFERRYRCGVAASEAYVLALSSYVALNPVRVGWVRSPEEWPWSSYAATVGAARRPGFLHTDALLGWFGGGRRGQERYAAFVLDRMEDEARR